LRDPVTIAGSFTVTVPAVTVNVLLVWPFAIVTLPGVVNCPVLALRVTVVAPTAALLSAAVQVVLWVLLSEDAKQVTLDNAGTAVKVRPAVLVTPFKLAVIVGFSSTVTPVTFAVN
jgi:hypothetical protein